MSYLKCTAIYTNELISTMPYILNALYKLQTLKKSTKID